MKSSAARIDEREWVAWGFANLTLPLALHRLRVVNVDRKARGEEPLGEPPFTGPPLRPGPVMKVPKHQDITDRKAVELVLRDLLAYRDTHVEVYGYEKQHYLIDSSLWDDAREVLRGY